MKDEILAMIDRYGAEIMEDNQNKRRYFVGKYMIIYLKPSKTYSITDENGEVDMSIKDKETIFTYAQKHPKAKAGHTLSSAMTYLRNQNLRK